MFDLTSDDVRTERQITLHVMPRPSEGMKGHLLALATQDLLVRELSAKGHLRVLPAGAHVDRVVSATCEHFEDEEGIGLQLSARISDLHTGELMGLVYAFGPDDLESLVCRVGAELRAKLGASAKDTTAAPISEARHRAPRRRRAVSTPRRAVSSLQPGAA